MTAIAFDLEDLPDSLSQAEALWMLSSLSHACALREAYRLITDDRKAWSDWDQVVMRMQRAVRRIYPEGEALFLIRLAEQKGLEGAKQQKEAMEAA